MGDDFNYEDEDDEVTVNENHPGEYAQRRRTMNIGEAIQAMRDGLAVTRKGWNGPNQWLRLQVPDSGSKMSLPYVYMKTVQGKLVPWLCSQTDLLATDWRLAE